VLVAGGTGWESGSGRRVVHGGGLESLRV
jgi:hypothetical protein